jgi:hypothetical protein
MIVPFLDVSFQGFSDWSLSERDVDVLSFLGEEDFAVFTFEGLKRRLGLHPETLSRILDRLEAEGVVKKSSEGYTVTKEIVKSLKHNGVRGTVQRAVLLQTFLPSDLSIEVLVSNLRGRWFGLLRWLGLAQNEHGISLKWVTEDGSVQIDAKVCENVFSIEAKFLHGFNQNLALKASYQLMTHISKLNSRPKSHANAPIARHVGYFEDSDFYSISA